MRKSNTDLLELQLNRLEHEISDDFNLLNEGGASYFSTEELRDLLLCWRLQLKNYNQYHYLSIGFLFAALASMTMAWLIEQLGFHDYAQKIFYTPPLFVSLSLIGQVWLRKKYRNREVLNAYGKIIQDELQRRRKQRDTSFS